MQIQFNYLYRDAGNFKQFGSVAFDNKECVPTEVLEEQFRKMLIDGQYFVAANIGVPNLWVYAYDAVLDHEWHEFEGLEAANFSRKDEDLRDISTLLDKLRRQQE